MSQTNTQVNLTFTQQWAAYYLDWSLNPIPVPHATKKPNRPGWHRDRFTKDNLTAFSEPCNIGLLLGQAGNYLCDMDLDSHAAVMLATHFLPSTKWCISRGNSPASHWLYYCKDSQNVTYTDPCWKKGDPEKAPLVEIRGVGSEIKGTMVLTAPSVHPDDGKPYNFKAEGNPASIDFANLQVAASRLAATALLSRYWPKSGSRHQASLALAGVLVESGIPEDSVEHIISCAAWAANDEEYNDRKQDVQTTAARYEAGEPITSWTEAAKYFDEKILREVVEWLNGQPTRKVVATNCEDQASFQLTNAINSGSKKQPLPLSEVLQQVQTLLGDGIFRVSNSLYVRDDGEGVRALKNTSDLFAHLHNRTPVAWHRGVGCITKDEFYSALVQNVRSYDAVEWLPHEPAVPNVFYISPSLKSGEGNALDGLIGRFFPATPEDRELIKSMFVTPMWGGPGGARPLFVITGDVGRGIGKTALINALGQLYGGAIWVNQKEDVAQLKTRILSTDGLKKRLIFLDNVKSQRFSWAELEALITAPEISGKQLYAGEGARPNLFTYSMTLNGVNLSRDLAQRAAIIKLNRPNYSGDWERDTRAYITTNQSKILEDVAAFLRTMDVPLSHTRWGHWEKAILSKVANPAAVQSLMNQRQTEVDADADEGELIESHFESQLRLIGYDPAQERISHSESSFFTLDGRCPGRESFGDDYDTANQANGQRRNVIATEHQPMPYLGPRRVVDW